MKVRNIAITTASLALLSAAANLSLMPTAVAQTTDTGWIVLIDSGDAWLFMKRATCATRADANAKVEALRDQGKTGVHAVPMKAYEAQLAAGLISPLQAEELCLGSK